ncbi:tRNA(Ile)-lysidine synthetase [Caldimicrobium thiodismutans]|uniref:tRNA(Ile)-lysidine synthase n=1 Tax=Caldimicrobium thiodismutans TaxID=1653476 RepID=A0A0U5AWN3_9BACT|nr:tRNA lysidine(34) synthetase TilS [Caldimicrobium thiodismutans]BAU22831.1 tRNA(Ile)-lysidine synthetase [Caldimicrobium thiodismutans]
MFLKKIRKFIEEYKLLRKGDRVLVGVSSGLDSLTLLETLFLLKKDLEIEIFVSHYDHKIRKGSHRDALFVYKYCKERGLPLFYTSSPVPSYAKREGLSLEMAGRELRYNLWYHLSKKYDFHRIALAHHLDDLVEEVFLKLIKGTGKRGLAGIPVKREEFIVRPFLFVSKEEIKNFAIERGLNWREDPTNQDLRIPRNKIRHILIPFLEKNFNPKIKETLKKTVSIIGEEEELIEELALENYDKIKSFWEEDLLLKIGELKLLPPVLRRRIYFLAFKEAGIPLFRITSRHLLMLDALILKQAKGPVYLPGNFLAYRGPGYLRLTKKVFTVPYFEIKVESPGHFDLPVGKLTLSLIPSKERPSQNSRNFQISADNLNPPFIIRKRKPGDKIYIPGIGHKKLKKFLQEKRIPSYLRDQLLIIERNGQIIGVWNVYVHPEYIIQKNTQQVWLFQIQF